MGRRGNIKNSIEINRIKGKLNVIEIYIVNILVVVFFVIIIGFYNSLGEYKVSLYDYEDIQSFNIDTNGLKAVYETAQVQDIELEKLLVMYAKSNNYFSEDTFVSEFSFSETNPFAENLKFAYFTLNKENKQIYNTIKSINEDIKALPFKAGDFESVMAINCFSVIKENYSTMFLEKEVSTKTIAVLSITDGVVVNIGYKGDKGLQIVIKTENDNKFVYSNIGEINNKIEKGTRVKSGDTLGTMGNTEQIKDKVTYERAKLGVYIVLDEKYLGKESYLNPYPFLYLKAIEHK